LFKLFLLSVLQAPFRSAYEWTYCWFQVMDFSPEEIAAFVAMVGVLSVVAQVK
jgi:hypothetical protein